jgi:PilZ domain
MFWRRRFPRLRKDFQIMYRMVDQEKFDYDPIKSLALNISGGGVCFEATDNLQKGALVALDIRSDDFNAPILALANPTLTPARYMQGLTIDKIIACGIFASRACM